MTPEFIQTKITQPPLMANQIQRRHIHSLISESVTAKLVILHGPAGFGKTSALIQYCQNLRHNNIDTVWMTIDSNDNDPARFLTCLSTAVKKLENKKNQSSNLVSPYNLSLNDITLDIIDRLLSNERPFAVFLDEFEHINERSILELLATMVNKLPARGKICITSRKPLDINLGRLRAKDQLLEIDSHHLRFSKSEVKDFFELQKSLQLTSDDINQLFEKTEGWIAALKLAAMALKQRSDPKGFIETFSGSQMEIAEYLAEDVLDRQPHSIRNFLLKTSLLEILTPPLCDRLIPNINSEKMLASLAASSLFLIPLNDNQGSYRYHRLFSSFLYNQLGKQYPHELPQLHRKVSSWYREQNRPIPAIQHAIKAGAYDSVVELLICHGENFLDQGRTNLLVKWIKQLPAEIVSKEPFLSILMIWATCFTRSPRDAMAIFEAQNSSFYYNQQYAAHINALQLIIFAMVDRKEEAYALAQPHINTAPENDTFAEISKSIVIAYTLCVMGNYEQSRALLNRLSKKLPRNENFFNRMYSEAISGIMDLEEGRLRQAKAVFHMALTSINPDYYTQTQENVFTGIPYAETLYEINDLPQSKNLLGLYLPMAKNLGMTDHLIIGLRLLSRIAFSQKDSDQGFAYIKDLENAGYAQNLPRAVASAKLEISRVLLLCGDKQGSSLALEQANDQQTWTRINQIRLPAHEIDDWAISNMRWKIHFEDSINVLKMVDEALAAAITAGRMRRALKLTILKSLAFYGQDNTDKGDELLRDALMTAATEGYIRIFTDEGDLLGRRIQAMASSRANDHDPIFREYLLQLSLSFGTKADSHLIGESAALHDSLTPMELKVLALLAQGHTNEILAEKLFVSKNTVRTHLRNINSKLACQNRTQAVAVARQLGLV
ncbi:MAG: LuxR C-terminal-related transcriptional regulator [Porticoccaceae bacterium]